jgi:Family of unknown function (DUF6058)
MPYPRTFPAEAADPQATDLTGAPSPRLSTPGELARRLAALDEAYIRAEFVVLDVLAAHRPGGAAAVRREIAAGRLPQPAYRLDDGTDMVPADYFALVDEAGSVAALPEWFRARYDKVRAGSACQEPAEEVWRDYLGGGYFVCLRSATPENIVLKADCIIQIDRLLADPAPASPPWQAGLRDAVERLSAIERPGSVLDPPRWGGPMSQQWYGAYLRTAYPAAFQAALR